MKFDELCAVGHNLADSLGSGASRLFNIWDDYVYREALASPQGKIEVDFLGGLVLSDQGSATLRQVVASSPQALSHLCDRHGVAPGSFRRLSACYIASQNGRQFIVTVEDQNRRCRTVAYDGISGKRLQPGKHPQVSSAHVS